VSLRSRSKIKEKLDDLSLSGNELISTLKSLKSINLALGNTRQIKKSVLGVYSDMPYQSETHIVDLGCGGGDVLCSLIRKLKRENINVTGLGIDGNAASIAYANKNNTIDESIKFSTADILNTDFIIPNCDILISTHFIYHFDDKSLISFLDKLKRTSVKHIIFSDLYRSKTAYFLFKIFSVILPVSKMAKTDGLLAIRRAFTQNELRAIIEASQFESYTIKKKPFFRLLIQISNL